MAEAAAAAALQQLESTVHMVRHEMQSPTGTEIARIAVTNTRQFFKEFYELSLPGVEGLLIRHSSAPDDKPSFELNGTADVHMAYVVARNAELTVNDKIHEAQVVFLPFVCFVFHGKEEGKRHYWMNDPFKTDNYLFEWTTPDGTIVRAPIKRSLRIIFEAYSQDFPALTKCIMDGPYAQVGKDRYIRMWDELRADYDAIRSTVLRELL